jgi:hypothetical protein
VGGAERGVGEGRSKKDAEQAAARVAWGVLVDGEDPGARLSTSEGDGETDQRVRGSA